MTKYIFVTGGVVSGLGKGITAASLGRLLPKDGSHHLEGKLFSAGDMRNGQSLVVRALADGRSAAKEIHDWLRGRKG